jgi:hypothetical protein
VVWAAVACFAAVARSPSARLYVAPAMVPSAPVAQLDRALPSEGRHPPKVEATGSNPVGCANLCEGWAVGSNPIARSRFHLKNQAVEIGPSRPFLIRASPASCHLSVIYVTGRKSPDVDRLDMRLLLISDSAWDYTPVSGSDRSRTHVPAATIPARQRRTVEKVARRPNIKAPATPRWAGTEAPRGVPIAGGTA